MSNMFSGLESMGLGKLSEINVFDKTDNEKNKEEKVAEAQQKESDFLFEKTYKCAVCDSEFKSKTIKVGKVKLLSADTDLRPKYQLVDSLKYDVVACPKCGYAALNRYFTYVTAPQIKLIKDNISATFKGLGEEGDIWSYDDAIARHQLALVNAIVKKSKTSERAYTCLKTAWLFRGKAENLPDDTADRDNVIKELNKSEAEYIANAYEGFIEAFSKEIFPMCGMDENTTTYLVADLARRNGKRDEALRHLSRVLTARDANERIKSKARELKDLLNEKK